MSSVTSYCPAVRGSWGGGYEGGVHLFTPGKAGAIEQEGVWGDKEIVQGTKQREIEERRWIAKRKHYQYCFRNRHYNTTSSHAYTKNRHIDIHNESSVLTFLHIKPEIYDTK